MYTTEEWNVLVEIREHSIYGNWYVYDYRRRCELGNETEFRTWKKNIREALLEKDNIDKVMFKIIKK